MRETVEHLRRKAFAAPRVAAALLGMLLLAACLLCLAPGVQALPSAARGSTAGAGLPVTWQPRLTRVAGLTNNKNNLVSLNWNADNSASITVQPAYAVTALADGEVLTAEMAEGTVADLLAETGVVLQGEDYVLPAPETPLQAGLAVRVYRVHTAEEVRRETLPAEAVAAYRAALPEGAAFTASYNGQYDVLYRDRLVNGAVESSTLLDMTPVLQPRPQDSFTIEEGIPCSRILGYDDVHFGPDGLPLGVTGVWEGAVCTAYSSSGGMGASGLGLYCGTVAVNPNVIPYGTRMYITSADGSFVYGFAIATDTGTAMMEGYVDLDLYFETNDECYQFGKRALNVYFLD